MWTSYLDGDVTLKSYLTWGPGGEPGGSNYLRAFIPLPHQFTCRSHQRLYMYKYVSCTVSGPTPIVQCTRMCLKGFTKYVGRFMVPYHRLTFRNEFFLLIQYHISCSYIYIMAKVILMNSSRTLMRGALLYDEKLLTKGDLL